MFLLNNWFLCFVVTPKSDKGCKSLLRFMRLSIPTEVRARRSLFSKAEMWNAYLFLLSAGGLLWNSSSTSVHCLVFLRDHISNPSAWKTSLVSLLTSGSDRREWRLRWYVRLIDKRLWSVWSAKNFWRTACKWMFCHRRSYVHILSHLMDNLMDNDATDVIYILAKYEGESNENLKFVIKNRNLCHYPVSW